MSGIFADSEPDPEETEETEETKAETKHEEPEFVGFPYTVRFVSYENYKGGDVISDNVVCINIETDINYLVAKGLYGKCRLGDILMFRLRKYNAKEDPIIIDCDYYVRIFNNKEIDLEEFKKELKKAIETDYKLSECEEKLQSTLGIFMKFSDLNIDIPEDIRKKINNEFPFLIEQSSTSIRNYKKKIEESIINDVKIATSYLSEGKINKTLKNEISKREMLSHYLSVLLKMLKRKKNSIDDTKMNESLKMLEPFLMNSAENSSEVIFINMGLLEILPYLVNFPNILKIFETFKIKKWNKFKFPNIAVNDDITKIYKALCKILGNKILIAGMIGSTNKIWEHEVRGEKFEDIVRNYFEEYFKLSPDPTVIGEIPSDVSQLYDMRKIPLQKIAALLKTKNNVKRLIAVCYISESNKDKKTIQDASKLFSDALYFLPYTVIVKYDVIKPFVENEESFPDFSYKVYDKIKKEEMIDRWKIFLLKHFVDISDRNNIILELKKIFTGEFQNNDTELSKNFSFLDINYYEVKSRHYFNETFEDVIIFLIEKGDLQYKKLTESSALDYFKSNKAVTLAAVSRDSRALRYASDGLKNDKEFVLSAVKLDGFALEWVSDFQKDEEVVLAAVEQDGHALQFASKELKSDPDFMSAAVALDGRALEYADDELKNEKEFVSAAVGKDWRALECVSKNIQDFKTLDDNGYKEVVLAAVEQNGHALQYVPVDFEEHDDLDDNDYKEVVLAAVKQNGSALMHASDKLINDKEVAMVAVKQNAHALHWVSEDLDGYRDVVLTAVSKDGRTLQYVSEDLDYYRDVVLAAVAQNVDALYYSKLNNDKEFVKGVVAKDWRAIQFASDDLKNDPDVVLAAVEQDGTTLQFFPALNNNPDVVLAAVAQNYYALEYASDELKNDPDVVMVAVKQYGLALQYASDEPKNDRDVVLAAVANDWRALQFAYEELKNDKEVVMAAVRQDWSALQFASDELKSDIEVVLVAVKQNVTALHWASDELKNDQGVVLAAVAQYGLALQYASDGRKSDKYVVLEAVKKDAAALYFASDELKKDIDVVFVAALQNVNALRFSNITTKQYHGREVLEKYLSDGSNMKDRKKLEKYVSDLSDKNVYDVLCDLKGKQAVDKALNLQILRGDGILESGSVSETKETGSPSSPSSDFAPVEYVEYYRTKSRLRFF